MKLRLRDVFCLFDHMREYSTYYNVIINVFSRFRIPHFAPFPVQRGSSSMLSIRMSSTSTTTRATITHSGSIQAMRSKKAMRRRTIRTATMSSVLVSLKLTLMKSTKGHVEFFASRCGAAESSPLSSQHAMLNISHAARCGQRRNIFARSSTVS